MPNLLCYQTLDGFMNLTSVRRDSWCKVKIVLIRYSMIFSTSACTICNAIQFIASDILQNE